MSAYKEVVFGEGQVVVVPNIKCEKDKKRNKRKVRKTKTIKKVVIKIKADKEALTRRMRTSEHRHGSMKRWDDAGYMLLKGKEKVTGEVALYCCAYNIRRAVNILGVKAILEYFENKKEEKIGKNEVDMRGKNCFTATIKYAIINLIKILRLEGQFYRKFTNYMGKNA